MENGQDSDLSMAVDNNLEGKLGDINDTSDETNTAVDPLIEPTLPRRVSSEDDTTSRPRKRPATMASVQHIELLNAEHIAARQQERKSPPSHINGQPRQPQPGQLQPDDDIDMAPRSIDRININGNDDTLDDQAGVSLHMSEAAVDLDNDSNGGVELDEATHNSKVRMNGRVVEDDVNGYTAFERPQAPSEAPTSPLSSPNHWHPHSASPEVEVAELEEMEEDDVQVLLVEDHYLTFPIQCDSHEDPKMVFFELIRCLEEDPYPVVAIYELEKCISLLALQDSMQAFLECFEMGRVAYLHFPQIMYSFLQRSEGFDQVDFIKYIPTYKATGLQLIMNLFDAFLRLAVRVINADILTCQSSAAAPVIPLSIEFQQVAAEIFSQSCPLYNMLSLAFNVELLSCQYDAIKKYTGEFKGVRVGRQLVEALLARATQQPDLLRCIELVLVLPAHILLTLKHWASSPAFEDADSKCISLMNYNIQEALAVYDACEGHNQKIVESSIAFQKQDFSKFVMRTARVLNVIISISEEASHQQLERLGISGADLPSGSIQELAQLVYKVSVFNMAIRKCKKIELRLFALNALCDELVSIWRYYDQNAEDPSLKHLSEVIKTIELIDYLLGPHSHFQLIQKAANIVGFTIVLNTFDQHVHDTIWRPIVENRDQRVAQATISMLRELASNMSVEQHTLNFETLQTLPLSSWDSNLLEYLQHILGVVCSRTLENGPAKRLELPPYRLLIHLMYSSFAAECKNASSGATSYSSIHDFSVKELRNLVNYGPPAEDRQALFIDCIMKLKELDPCASCSVQVLHFLLLDRATRPSSAPANPEPRQRLAGIIEGHNILHLLEQNIAGCLQSGISNNDMYIKLRPYFDILAFIISELPECISLEQGSKLWSYLCGEGSTSALRDCSFDFFSRQIDHDMVSHRNTSNKFLENCFTVYFAQLDAKYFVTNVLEFCKKSIESLKNDTTTTSLESGEIVEIEGMEQIWRIILESSDQELAINAVKYFVNTYLDCPSILRSSLDSARATHTAIIQRCINQLTLAANSLRSPSTMEDSTHVSETDQRESVARKRLEYMRSLVVLTEFLKAHKARPRYANKFTQGSSAVQSMVGNPLVLKVQGHGNKIMSIAQEIQVGDLMSGDELYTLLADTTGFANYRLITLGKEIFLKGEQRPIKELNFVQRQFLLITHRPTENESSAISMANLTSVETETLKHFDELYSLLSLPVVYSQLIWTLLKQFPPQAGIRDLLNAPNTRCEDVFPSESPFRIYYSLYTLRRWLQEEAENEGTFQEKAERTVQWLAIAIVNTAHIEEFTIRTSLLNDMFECILLAMKSLGVENVNRICFASNNDFVIRLIMILDETTMSVSLDYSDIPLLIGHAFQALLFASAFNSDVWSALINHSGTPAMVEKLLLRDPRVIVRQGVKSQIETFCSKTLYLRRNSISQKNADEMEQNRIPIQLDYAVFFWPILLKAMESASSMPSIAAELFATANTVFQQLHLLTWPGLELERYAIDWSQRLMQHEHIEIVGRFNEDYVLPGYASLLVACLQYLDVNPLDMAELRDLPHNVLARYLFPPLTATGGDTNVSYLREVAPVLGTEIREHLYRLVQIFLHNVESVEKMVDLISSMFPEVFNDGPPGFNIDRARWLRSPTGYVGLMNQSNTCYLNSLLTQLFMNINFRKVLLGVKISNRESQSLLQHTQELFANMQNSWQKAFEPREFTTAIRDYDNQPIDVSVQMDVDEFYNLLFDRLEGQIESIDDRNSFRALYGGQLVQQVKSKECDHVSEREEPFSAIQCDIKGKQTLQESLKAYVEGEIMAGDNKYSCTGCNKHVDAVKRTCLKQVPNHLIFHLKRFEFDIRTMLRSKINDTFEFPTELDIRPYTIDAIADQENAAKPDIFELVGVLVHSGTAESGHYYSYIRERLAQPGKTEPYWFEFNDSEVSSFDPSTIGAACFGGTDILPTKDNMPPLPFSKSYSAYMLFYERKTSLQETAENSLIAGASSKLQVPQELHETIFHENEVFARKYCLFDSPHLLFTTSLLERLQELSEYKCSETHILEEKTVLLVLNSLESIAIRIKDCADLDSLFKALTNSFIHCINCCAVFVQWFVDKPDATRNFLLRCPLAKARQDISDLLILALSELREKRSDAYGFEWLPRNDYCDTGGFFNTVLDNSLDLFEILSQNMKTWDDFFGFIAKLAALGVPECQIMLQKDLLKRCMEILLIEYVPVNVKREYGTLARLVDKGRKPFYNSLMDVIATIFEVVDVGGKYEDGDRETNDQNTDLLAWTPTERMYALYYNKKVGIAFINKPLESSQNIEAIKKIIRKLLSQNGVTGITNQLLETLYIGVSVDPANLALPYLHGLLAVAEGTSQAIDIRELVKKVAQEVQTIGNAGGKEHFEFFKLLYSTSNPKFNSTGFIRNRVVEHMFVWVPPLITYWDAEVRTMTGEFVEEHLLGNLAKETERIQKQKARLARELFTACFNWIEEKMLKSRFPMRDQDRFIEVLTILNRCCDVQAQDEGDRFRSKIKTLTLAVERVLVDEEVSEVDWQQSDVDVDSNHDMDIINDDYST